jgi:hypothetical protein
LCTRCSGQARMVGDKVNLNEWIILQRLYSISSSRGHTLFYFCFDLGPHRERHPGLVHTETAQLYSRKETPKPIVYTRNKVSRALVSVFRTCCRAFGTLLKLEILKFDENQRARRRRGPKSRRSHLRTPHTQTERTHTHTRARPSISRFFFGRGESGLRARARGGVAYF